MIETSSVEAKQYMFAEAVDRWMSWSYEIGRIHQTIT
jgi:hypothetical protein